MDDGGALRRRTLLKGALAVPVALAAGCERQSVAGDPAGAPLPSPSSSSSKTPSAGAGPVPSGSPAPTPSAATPATTPSAASPAQIARRATVPVLCWHQVRDWRSDDGPYARRLLICPPRRFTDQLDALAEDGWTTIGPDDYLAHLTTGRALPAKPVLLSFDDAQGTHASAALPQLRRRDMTATFFAMTVVLDKPGWLSGRDVARLADAGMTVAAHTYDHARVDRYGRRDWREQLERPRELLERLAGAAVEHFAYPYGAWRPAALPHVRAAGYRSAYQLADAMDDRSPLLTLRRDLVDSTWSGRRLLAFLRRRG